MQWDRPLTGDRPVTFPGANVNPFGRELHPSLTKYLSRRWKPVTAAYKENIPTRSASCPPKTWMFASQVPRPLPLSSSSTRTGTNSPRPDPGPTPTNFGQWCCYSPEPRLHGPRAPTWEAYAPGRSFNREVEESRTGCTPKLGVTRGTWNFKARARLEENDWEKVQCRANKVQHHPSASNELQHRRMMAKLEPLLKKAPPNNHLEHLLTAACSEAQVVPLTLD